MEEVIRLDENKYESFLRILGLLKDVCSDVDIRNGFIRQRTNENSCIFEIDLNSILNTISIPLTDLKSKLDLLKIFLNQEVEILVNETHCKFKDKYSSLSIVKAQPAYMDNTFITEDERNASFVLTDDNLILSTEIPTTICERISVIKQGFFIDHIQVEIEGNQALLSAKSESKEQTARVMEGIIPEISTPCHTDLKIIPFIIDHDGDMSFKMYNIDGVSINRIDTSIGDIPITVYSRSSLILT